MKWNSFLANISIQQGILNPTKRGWLSLLCSLWGGLQFAFGLFLDCLLLFVMIIACSCLFITFLACLLFLPAHSLLVQFVSLVPLPVYCCHCIWTVKPYLSIYSTSDFHLLHVTFCLLLASFRPCHFIHSSSLSVLIFICLVFCNGSSLLLCFM